MDAALLVGDVGGTNVRFAVAVRRGGQLRAERFEAYPDQSFPAFDDALRAYLDQSGIHVGAACFAAAGPVIGGDVHLTNRDWIVSSKGVSKGFGIPDVVVINDFLAMARAVPELEPGAFEVLFEGEAVEGAPILVAGPGTGFGVSTLVPTECGWTVISGEGGHIAYAPRTELERDVARLLARDCGYVSNELVASGSGLPEVHAAFCEIYGVAFEPLTPVEMRKRADAGNAMYLALIELRAMAVMGAVGDLALINGCRGGVVLAGGVTERISDFLRTPEAFDRFAARGPMSDYLKRCPVRLLRDPVAPLIGAAAHFEQVSGRAILSGGRQLSS